MAVQAAPEIATVEQARSQIPLAGDLVAALCEKIGVAQAVKAVADFLGRPCNCDERRRRLNELDRWARNLIGLKAPEGPK
jgi:hypothetical protein